MQQQFQVFQNLGLLVEKNWVE